jgi:hypothetical protein
MDEVKLGSLLHQGEDFANLPLCKKETAPDFNSLFVGGANQLPALTQAAATTVERRT